MSLFVSTPISNDARPGKITLIARQDRMMALAQIRAFASTGKE